MTIKARFSFEITVQSLARVLAQIKPTPWEKVSVSYQTSFNGQIDNRFHAAREKKITSHPKFYPNH